MSQTQVATAGQRSCSHVDFEVHDFTPGGTYVVDGGMELDWTLVVNRKFRRRRSHDKAATCPVYESSDEELNKERSKAGHRGVMVEASSSSNFSCPLRSAFSCRCFCTRISN